MSRPVANIVESSDPLPIRVRRVISTTRDGTADNWGPPIAAFRYAADAQRFVDGQSSLVIEKEGKRVVGRDGHGYAILEALERAAVRSGDTEEGK